MKKTEVFFFFDTEDFTSETNADATLALANIMTEEGVVGHFAMVGLVAEQFSNWGRQDTIEALRPHIIGTHTYGHTLHPDIVEQSEGADYDAAYQRVMETEAAAVKMIQEHLGTNEILFACPPGDSKSYVAMYAYHNMGIPFYCDTVVHDAQNTLVDYAGMTHIPYTRSLEGMFFAEDAQEDHEILDTLTSYERVIIYTHPNITVKKQFWDSLNYAHENLHPYGDWLQAEDRSPEEIQHFRSRFRCLIRSIQADSRFEITDLRKLQAKLDGKPGRMLTPDMLPEIRTALEEKLYPPENGAYSIAEVFQACAAFLRGENEYYPADHLTCGFLSHPTGITAPVTVSRTAVMECVQRMDFSGFLPAQIAVDTHTLGPADFLFAMLALLTTEQDTVVLMPREQSVVMEAFEELKYFHMDGNSWMHSYDFQDEYVSERLRLQSWTLRYSGV